MKHFAKYGALILAAALSVPVATLAKKKTQKKEDAPIVKTDYKFPYATTPQKLYECGTTVYSTSGNQVSNMSGIVLAKEGLKVHELGVSPANNRYLLIYDTKKGTQSILYSTEDVAKIVMKLKPKKYGQLVSAIYSPDARRVLLGGKNRTVVTTDARKLTPIDTLKLSIEPKVMEMSNNGYYLAVTDGKNVTVYNFEEKKPRQSWNFEANVTDMKFNNDGTEFAVLTDDGLASIYDTRSFIIKKDYDDLGAGIGLGYNFDGKWMAVATSADNIRVINLLDSKQNFEIPVESGQVSDLVFIPDAEGRTLLCYTTDHALKARRMWNLSPYYGKLVKEQADAMMNEWLKMMPGETIDEYRKRVNDDSRKRQRALFEAEIASGLANDLLAMSTVSLGKYDRANKVLEVNFSNMPSIFLPVEESDLGAFHKADELEFRNSKYGVMGDDNFELIYAEVFNKNDGKTYIYDNLERASLNYMEGDDNVVSLEVIQQQQMEELKLQELRRKVMEEAKSRQVISDHTNITVNSEVIPDYDANGKRILNYKVSFSYEVEPEFSATEDFAPGKYHVGESGAASSMLNIVKQAFEGELSRHLTEGKKLLVNIKGAADGTPIRSTLAYDGAYGDFEEEPVRQNGQLTTITVTKKDGMATNEQLAFIRGAGVQNYLNENIKNLSKMNTDYTYNVDVAEGKGSEFRRITVEFTFVDANLQ